MTLNNQNCLSCVVGDISHRLWRLLSWLQWLMPALCLYESYGTEGNIWSEIICLWFITKKNVFCCLYLAQSTFVFLSLLVADKSHINNCGILTSLYVVRKPGGLNLASPVIHNVSDISCFCSKES